MFYAFFISCVINTTTGATDCSNSYTEMASVMRQGESCPEQAKKLQEGAMQSVLIQDPRLIAVMQRSGCGTLKEVLAEATESHNSYVKAGIKSALYGF